MIKLLIVIITLLSGCQLEPSPEPIRVEAGEFPWPDTPPPPVPDPIEPGFLGLALAESIMVADAQSLRTDAEREASFYMVTCDDYNLDNQTPSHKQGIDLGVNYLSTERFVERSVQVTDCIFRIDERDYGWGNSWQINIRRNQVLPIIPQTIRGQQLQNLLQREQPYYFAKDFLITAFEGDAVTLNDSKTYRSFMNIPGDLRAFLRQQGVNLQRAYDDQDVILAGFSRSKIAIQKPRKILLVPSVNGYCTATYDTVLGGDNLFQNPFSVEEAKSGVREPDDPEEFNTQKIFLHDAQEWICSSANGFMATYYLNNANGIAEGFAPTTIVLHRGAAAEGLDPTIYIGSCSGCHFPSPLLGFQDELAAHIAGGPGFDETEKLLGRTYYSSTRMQAFMNVLNDEALVANQNTGITDATNPLYYSMLTPFRLEQDLAQIAGYVFLPAAEFEKRLRATEVSRLTFGNLLNGGRVDLATLKQGFPDLIREIGAYREENL